jgi:MHS family proline/betaine transporter-like MFS transporter
MGSSAALSSTAFEVYGWRVAFFIGAGIVPVGLYLRRYLPEAPALGDERIESGFNSKELLALVVGALLVMGARSSNNKDLMRCFDC